MLEYLAVCQLTQGLKGPLLCLVGAPGVGKTSIGRSVAKTLGRKFHRYLTYRGGDYVVWRYEVLSFEVWNMDWQSMGCGRLEVCIVQDLFRWSV